MSNILLLNTPFVFDGLGTLTNTIATTGLYNVTVTTTDTPSSSLSIVVNQNGSPVYTAPVLSPTQGAIQFKTELVCAATDTITVVLSSSAAVDKLLNTVKSTITLISGT